MSMRGRDFDTVTRKYSFQTRNTHHLLAWFEHDGKVVVRTKRSHTPRSRDLPAERQILRQLGLTQEEFRRAVSCSIDRDGYLEILRQKGII